jgi:hypothetical protein
MLIPLLILMFVCMILPAICVYTLNRGDVDPSIRFLGMLILSPFVHFLILVLRRNL